MCAGKETPVGARSGDRFWSRWRETGSDSNSFLNVSDFVFGFAALINKQNF